MGSKRLENAAAAAGYAMVNPDDFAVEAKPELQLQARKVEPAPAAKTWLPSWDYSRLMGGKAPA